MAIDQEIINHAIPYLTRSSPATAGTVNVPAAGFPSPAGSLPRARPCARSWRWCEGPRRRTPRSDLRGARYGKETDRLRSTSPKQAAAGPFVHVVCGALRESDLAEKLFGRGEHGARSETARRRCLSWRKPAEGPCSWKTLRSCLFGAKPGYWRSYSRRVAFPRRRPAGAGIDVRVIASSTRGPVRRHGAAGFPVEPVLLPQGRRDPRSAAAASLPRYWSPRGKLPGDRQRHAGEPRRQTPMPLRQQRPCNASWSTTGPATRCNWRVSSPMRSC